MYRTEFKLRNGAAVAIRDEPVADNFAECPGWARALLDHRLASLDRGDGLTSEQMADQMRVWREERRRAKEVVPDDEPKEPSAC